MMDSTDPRWDSLAKILVRYSTRVRADDKVAVGMLEVETFPLVRAVCREVVRAGGYPQVLFQSATIEGDMLRLGAVDMAARVPDLEAHAMEWADVYVGLRGARSPAETAGVDPSRFSAHRRAVGQVSALRNRHTRWVVVRVPGEPLAQEAGMTLSDTMEFFFTASLRPWARDARQWRALARLFERAGTVTLQSPDTALTFTTRGRRYLVGDGHINMPDGEIYTAPEDESATGYITFDVPANYWGARVEGIRLAFEQGRVVDATASTNESVLRQVVELDDGASRIGEFGVGTNTGIPCFFADILYDEKMAGTVHLALGRAYEECGGVNQSSVHWDLVKDMRRNGRILLDGRTVFENGRWLTNESDTADGHGRR